MQAIFDEDFIENFKQEKNKQDNSASKEDSESEVKEVILEEEEAGKSKVEEEVILTGHELRAERLKFLNKKKQVDAKQKSEECIANEIHNSKSETQIFSDLETKYKLNIRFEDFNEIYKALTGNSQNSIDDSINLDMVNILEEDKQAWEQVENEKVQLSGDAAAPCAGD